MADNELNIRLKVNDDGSVVMDKFAQSIKNVEKNAQGMSQALNVIRYDSIVNLGQKALQAGRQFMELVEAGAKVKSIEDSFILVGKNSGVAIDELIKNLKKVTNETIDDSDLMKKAMRLMTEGFSADQITQIGAAARTAARLMGTDVSTAYGEMADSIVNLRERGLKTAGFIIDLDEAYAKQAKTLGVTKEQLNDYGKQMAIVNAVAEKNLELQRKLNIESDTEYELLQKKAAKWQEIKEAVGGLALEAWKELQSYISSTYQGIVSIIGLMDRASGGDKNAGINAYDLYGGKPLSAPSAKSQIKTDPYAQKYGMSEAVLKDRLSDSKLLYEQWMKNWEVEGNLYKVEMDRAQVLADDMFPSEEKVRGIVNQANQDYEKQRIILVNIQGLVKDFGWEDYAAGLEGANDGTRELNRLTIANAKASDDMLKKIKTSDEIFQSFGSALSSAWSTNLTNMIKGSQTFSESVKNIFSSMGDSIINTITKMIANWLLFGSLTGKTGGTSFFGASSGGYGGLLGGIGSILGLAEGGIFTSPTAAIVGDAGPEAVIPLKNGKVPIEGGGGGDVYIVNYNQVTDPNTFVKIYGPIVKKLSDQSAAEAKRFRPGAK
jgi:hypothetical protein